jgi:hypothetical protein
MIDNELFVVDGKENIRQTLQLANLRELGTRLRRDFSGYLVGFAKPSRCQGGFRKIGR